VDATFPPVRLAEVAAAAEGEVQGPPRTEVRDASYDSRDVRSGSLFFCVPGEIADGHDFAADAVRAGAAAIVVERPVEVDAPRVVVASVRAAMGPMSAVVFGHPAADLTVAGITGTNGKTTGTYLLESVFRAAGWRPAVVGTTGLRIDGVREALAHTTPEAPDLHRALFRMRAEHVDAVAIEISSHALAQRRTDGLVADVALFTNLSQDHLDFHPSMEEYFQAKRRLFTPAHARHGVINADDAWGRRLLASGEIATTSYAVRSEEADVTASDVRVGRDGIVFTVDGLEIHSPLRGAFNVSNCLGVLAVARTLSIDDAATIEGIAALDVVPGRMEPVDAGQPFTVVVDYAHTPDSIHSVLRGARPLADGQVIIVFGCGGDRDQAKRPAMGRAATDDADLVIVTTDNPRSEDPERIIADVLTGVPASSPVVVEPDRRAAIARAVDAAGPGDVVVFAGKGHETSQEIDGRFVPFDDRAVAREAIEARLGAR
jgi:UDP-N-acetylmuramoyl-L-alanyl-D-glutamate--2,6-diaminopimelate ligase